MGKTEKLPNASDTRADKQKRQLRWIQIRRRIIGALAVAAITAVVLQLGDIKHPSTTQIAALPNSAIAKPQITPDLQDARRRLQQTPEIIIPENTNTTSSQLATVAKLDDTDAQPTAKDEEASNLAAIASLFFGDDLNNAATNTISTTEKSNTTDGDFVVQVGAFADAKRAEKIAKVLRDKSYQVILESIEHNNNTLTRVRVGNYKSREEAENVRKEITALGYDEARVNDLR